MATSGASVADEGTCRYYVTASEVAGIAVLFLGDRHTRIEVGLAPGRGAEIVSLRHDGKELLHRGLDFSVPEPADAWPGRAPLLYPAVGRQRDGMYTWAGESHAMPVHGFAKDCAFLMDDIEFDDDSAQAWCSLTSSQLPEQYRVLYPFEFKLSVCVRVCEGKVEVQHVIHNTQADSSSAAADAAHGYPESALLPFAIGNHITFRFPLLMPSGSGSVADEEALRGAWAAGRIHCSMNEECELGPGALLTGTRRPVPELLTAEGMPLTHTLATDSVLGAARGGARPAKSCQLVLQQAGGPSVTIVHDIHGPERSHDFDSARSWEEYVRDEMHYVLWGQAPAGGNAGFICPEPWISGPDSLNSRSGLPTLRPGESATWATTISVEAHASK